jgi:hypothetical protein
VPWSEAAAYVRVRRGGLVEFEMRRARGRTSHAGTSALGRRAVLRWPSRVGRGKGRGGLQLSVGWVFGSWREPGRILRGSVAGCEDG